jgi:serralysin
MYSRGVQYNNGQTLRDEIQTEFTGKTREDFEVELYAVAAYDKALNYNRLEKNSNYHKAPEVRKVNLLDHCDERIITNNAPVITSDAIFAAAENQRSVGSVTVDDVDGDDITYTIAHNYSQIGGGTLPRLTISQDGIISFDDTVNSTVYPPPDFERYNTYNATVTVSDGIFSDSQNITINISDINEAPTFKLDSECIQWSVGGANGCGPSAVPLFSVEENKTSIGDVQAYDDDGDSLAYSISGTDAALINIDSSTGVLSFTSAPDYETKSSYSAIVTANDGSLTGSLDITVNVTDVNEAPAFTSNATFSAAENQTAIDTVTATDADGDDVTFTVSGSELAITSAGVLTFASAPDYETKTSYTATVTASDGTNSTTQAITVNVTDVNEAPTFTSSATFSAAENQTAIGTVAVSDVDGDTISYSISGSDITINSSSGVIAFASAPNYETKSSYTATVSVTDGTNTTTQAVTINITDVNDAPIINSYFPSTFTVAENGGQSSSVLSTTCSNRIVVTLVCEPNGTVNIGGGNVVEAFEDEDDELSVSGNLRLTFSGTDASFFGATPLGEIYFDNGSPYVAPDYETKSS